jgi:hypothetical protein
MRTFARIFLIVVAASWAACGGSGGSSPTSPTGQTLAGTWKATKAEFVGATNSSQRVEIVAMGTTLILTLDGSGSYTQKITDPGQGGQTTTGTWSASKDVLTLKPAGRSGDIQFDMTLNGTTLTLDKGHVSFDVNLDGRDEEALASLTLVRQ